MATPWKLITKKNDPWTVKVKKKLARRLWNDLTRRQDASGPVEGLPPHDPPEKLLRSFDVRRHFSNELRRAQEEMENEGGRGEP
jgi:hypothetical protein